MIRDVTTRKQAEERLRQTQLENLQLVEADRLKNQFLSTLSHELRTPMNAILGFSGLLLRQLHQRQDAQLIEMVERIARNGKNLLVMIEEMLDFARWKSNHLDLNPETFDVIELIYTTANELRSLANHKSLELRVHHAVPELSISNDRTRLRQILTNLIANPIKFTDVGSVTIEIHQLSEAWFRIIVSDTGIGINPADQSHIFREFWQVNSTITRRYGGTGLGLALFGELMPNHDIIVIGSSAGGVEALTQLVKHFPADFLGTLFVVVHFPA
jgi:signal transduction histidine kinase